METAVKNQKSSPDRQQLPIVQVALTLSARLTRRQKRMRNEQQHADGDGGGQSDWRFACCYPTQFYVTCSNPRSRAAAASQFGERMKHSLP